MQISKEEESCDETPEENYISYSKVHCLEREYYDKSERV
jgi:hypothetical protein